MRLLHFNDPNDLNDPNDPNDLNDFNDFNDFNDSYGICLSRFHELMGFFLRLTGF
jgi:hypothetical protein